MSGSVLFPRPASCWVALALLVVGSTAATVAAPYPLDDQLCLDINGTLPNYNSRLPAAPAGSPRPMRKRTLTAQCNDGTPAVMYIRPAPAGSPNANRWVLFLDGGGNCGDADDCIDRWCSLSGDWLDFAGKMTSRNTPPAIDPPQGILSRNPANRFSNWNHVFVAYCTSDNHVGSAPLKTVTPSATGPYVGFDYQIQFNGEAVVNEVFSLLRSGPTVPDDGNRECAVPDLANGQLLFAAESAGEVGKRHHLDRITALLAADGVQVLGVGDANFGPDMTTLPNWAGSPYASYDDMMVTRTEPQYRTFWETDDSALDASCLASGVASYYCLDTIYTVLNQITTPSFLRADLTDPMGVDRYLGWGFFANDFELARATRAQYARLPAGWGWFGPHCDIHVQIQGRGFGSTNMLAGTGRTFHDELWNWVNGLAGPKRETQSDANNMSPYDMSLLCF